eukprot:TRINITY_DN9495_c0_g1_i4.p1 TRINITY_DN9495_c0_g1~~TRINITY_DN9495_c0_g1_i4.p1  ORF type:complete len:405 (+),score=71.00 TRINITY_DN9495_c0_g1_i4:128-1342(+)
MQASRCLAHRHLRCLNILSRTMATKATINYDDFLTKSSKLRQPSPIRALQPLLSIPGMISLGGGMPNPTTFPVTGMSFQLQDGQTLSLSPEETRAALQYSQTTGLPALNEWLTDLIVREHAPPQANQLKLCITTGSQEAAARAMEMLLEPEQDALLIESPTYSGALAAVYPMRVKLVKVPTDDNGLIPDALGKLLDNWDEEKERCRKPRVIYTIPTGSNPSGATLSLERRKQLYAICQHHNLLIMEDDPYRYLDFAPGRIPSLLSMDVDGRVLRFDSFSKIVSSGLRLGFVSGPAPLVDRIVLHGQAVSLHPSGISQALLLKLLEHWGPDGFEEHVAGVVDFYKAQRDAFLASAEVWPTSAFRTGGKRSYSHCSTAFVMTSCISNTNRQLNTCFHISTAHRQPK